MKFIKYFENNQFEIGDIVYVIDKNNIRIPLELDKKYTVGRIRSPWIFITELQDYFMDTRFVSEEKYIKHKALKYNIL